MATLRKRLSTEQEIGETTNNSESDLSSEEEPLEVFDYVSIDAGDEDLPGERPCHRRRFTPTISQFVGESGLQNKICLVEGTPLDYLQLQRIQPLLFTESTG